MCVFKYHAFIFYIRPPRWRCKTDTKYSAFNISIFGSYLESDLNYYDFIPFSAGSAFVYRFIDILFYFIYKSIDIEFLGGCPSNRKVTPTFYHVTCLCSCCMSMSMLHINVHSACPHPCCTSMSMLYVHVYVYTAYPCPCPCCMYLSVTHVHCPCYMSMSM